MISLKCRNCGGEMSIDAKGELACPYCGNKAHLSDVEYAEYKNFRLNLLNFLRSAADQKADAADDTFLWNSYHETEEFYSREGKKIIIDYMFYAREDGVPFYVAKSSVIYIFNPEDSAKVEKMTGAISRLEYPSADIRNLTKYFPTVKSRMVLEDGRILVAVSKPENVYPLFAFGNLRPKHVAWIVSRMENFCCLFEYNGIVQEGISLNSVFINPRTHEAYLYGNWWMARAKKNERDQADLKALRVVADRLMGEYKEEAPQEFIDFIQNAPAEDAYTDFELWDTVIEDGFGGHKFTVFSQN